MKDLGDRGASLFLLILAGFVCQQSMSIGVGTLVQPGPGLLAFGAGAGMGLLALALLIRTFLEAPATRVPPETEENGGHWATVVAVGVTLFVYALAVDRLGFVLATLPFVFVLARIARAEPWWHSALKAVLVTAGNYLVFVLWMGLRLPEGVMPW